MSEATVGSIVKDHNGKVIRITKEPCGQGCIFKDFEAYEKYPKDPCYVPELHNDVWTGDDFLELAEGDKEIADHLFYHVDWQSPTTALDEDFRDGEIIRCGSCKKLIWAKMEGIETCPHCNAPTE